MMCLKESSLLVCGRQLLVILGSACVMQKAACPSYPRTCLPSSRNHIYEPRETLRSLSFYLCILIYIQNLKVNNTRSIIGIFGLWPILPTEKAVTTIA